MKTSIISLSLAAVAIASPGIDLGALHSKDRSATPSNRSLSHGHGDHGFGSPFRFTSTYTVLATPQQVFDASNNATGGLSGALGWYMYGINSHENVICYNITLEGFRGNYSSAAVTATHIHEGPKGRTGPPRIAFPDPVPTGEGDKRNSIGCLRGPFTTGMSANGTDTGADFHVRRIESDPAAFFTDVHSSLAVAGAVRGQLDHDYRTPGRRN